MQTKSSSARAEQGTIQELIQYTTRALSCVRCSRVSSGGIYLLRGCGHPICSECAHDDVLFAKQNHCPRCKAFAHCPEDLISSKNMCSLGLKVLQMRKQAHASGTNSNHLFNPLTLKQSSIVEEQCGNECDERTHDPLSPNESIRNELHSNKFGSAAGSGVLQKPTMTPLVQRPDSILYEEMAALRSKIHSLETVPGIPSVSLQSISDGTKSFAHKFVVMFSGYRQGSELSRFELDVKELGATVSSSIPTEQDYRRITHLICKVDEERMVKTRTMKYLMSSVRGIPIVCDDWLRESVKERRWIGFEQYLARGDAVCRNRPKHWLVKAPSLFAGIIFVLEGIFTPPAPSRRLLTMLIEAGGGCVKSLSDLMTTRYENLERPRHILIALETKSSPSAASSCIASASLSLPSEILSLVQTVSVTNIFDCISFVKCPLQANEIFETANSSYDRLA